MKKILARVNYKQTALVIVVLLLLVGFWGGMREAQASELGEKITGKLDQVQINSKLPNPNSPVEVVVSVVKGILGLVALIFFIMIIIGGVKWMASGGNEQVVEKAKKTIGQATIGVAVIILSYAISILVFDIILGV